MNLTTSGWIFIGIVLFASSIIGTIIRYNDIKNNTVRRCCSDSRKKLETKKPPNYKNK